MAWKGLHLTQPAKLSLADGQCCVKRDNGEVRIAIEDLAWIVLDTAHATLTSTLISACMDAGVAIVFTDSRHTPSGLALPFHRHHRQGAVARLQADTKESLKNRLWQTIIRRKILNQAALLSELGKADAATLKEIEAQGWSLNPGRYVGVAAGEAVSDEDFKEQLETLNEELETLNAQARDLEQTIAGNVAEILEA